MSETPKRRSLIDHSSRQTFVSPLASSTPKKQVLSSNLEEEGVDSDTDSLTTILVSPRRNYRREVRLLRVRLEEIKLKIRQESSFGGKYFEDKENLRGEQEKFFSGIQQSLLESCDQLLGQCRNQDQWAREQKLAVEQMYKVHLEELSSEVSDLRDENSKLRQKLTLIDSKISEVLGENKYLRWETEQSAQTITALQCQLNQKSLNLSELQAEIHCLKTNQSEINRLHALKLQTSIQDVRQEEATKRENLKHEYEKSPKTIEKLAENNRQLYTKLMENQRQLNEQTESFKSRESVLLNEVDKLRQSQSSSFSNKSNGSKTNSPEKSIRFGTVERISTDGRVFCQSIAEWEEKFGVLRREYELEREQRRNLTKLLVEMSRDMKTLLGKNTSVIDSKV